MATYVSLLKPTVFLTLQEIGDHLALQADKYEVPADPAPFPKGVEELRRTLERFINISCDKVESIIQTKVIAQDFEEVSDGNNSNVIVPSKWPITEITEIKIDFNRAYGPETTIDLSNAVLRGFADRRQQPSDVSLRIIGNDIALRDDGKDSFLGKIFSGSSIGAVKIKYKAGWGKDAVDIPSDLKYAAILLCEYYYYQRSNRDLNVNSKGIRGESYQKNRDGIPDTIMELLEPYIDTGLPLHQKSQTNTFGI